jgi:hypothetical protein
MRLEGDPVKHRSRILFGLGVTAQSRFAAIGGGDVHLDHPHGGELLQRGWGMSVPLSYGG